MKLIQIRNKLWKSLIMNDKLPKAKFIKPNGKRLRLIACLLANLPPSDRNFGYMNAEGLPRLIGVGDENIQTITMNNQTYTDTITITFRMVTGDGDIESSYVFVLRLRKQKGWIMLNERELKDYLTYPPYIKKTYPTKTIEL